MLTRSYLTLLLLVIISSGYGQQAAINTLSTQYRNWLTGEGVDYSRSEINQRYTRFLLSGNNARDLSAYDFSHPGPAWDFTVAADQRAYYAFVEQKLIRLVFLYQLKGPAANPNPAFHRTTLRDTILQVFNYRYTSRWE
jgi:hypothetical protein